MSKMRILLKTSIPHKFHRHLRKLDRSEESVLGALLPESERANKDKKRAEVARYDGDTIENCRDDVDTLLVLPFTSNHTDG
ncbi:hypothetical protein WG66_007844 [Moniliophthora roreri]|nr:hypothetical protein WG66_007844 [Moniliophthora roreri]